MKIEAPLVLTVFPTSTTSESYLLILSEDGTLEVFVGERKKLRLDASEYDDAMDWFVKINTHEKCRLGSESKKVVNDLTKAISFSEIQNRRMEVDDGWERMLFIDSKAYYMYGILSEQEDPSLAKLIDRIIEYSPIKVDMHGWS